MIMNKQLKWISLLVFMQILIGCAISPSPRTVSVRKSIDYQQASFGVYQITGYSSEQVESELMSILMQKGATIVERSRLSYLLTEHGLQQSGLTDDNVRTIGKIAAVDYIIIANTSVPTSAKVANWKDNTWETFTATFTCRIIDTKDGKVVFSGSGNGARGYPNFAISDAIKSVMY
jgi:hypothetical protein